MMNLIAAFFMKLMIRPLQLLIPYKHPIFLIHLFICFIVTMPYVFTIKLHINREETEELRVWIHIRP